MNRFSLQRIKFQAVCLSFAVSGILPCAHAQLAGESSRVQARSILLLKEIRAEGKPVEFGSDQYDYAIRQARGLETEIASSKDP